MSPVDIFVDIVAGGVKPTALPVSPVRPPKPGNNVVMTSGVEGDGVLTWWLATGGARDPETELEDPGPPRTSLCTLAEPLTTYGRDRADAAAAAGPAACAPPVGEAGTFVWPTGNPHWVAPLVDACSIVPVFGSAWICARIFLTLTFVPKDALIT